MERHHRSRSVNRGPALVNQHLFKVEPSSLVTDRFLFHLLRANLDRLVAASHGTTMTHIKRKDLLVLEIALPSLDEQRRIAEILDAVDAAINLTHQLIAKRRRLLSGLAAELFASVSQGTTASLASVSQFFDDGDWIEAPYITDKGVRLIQTGNIGVGTYLDKVDRRRFVSTETFETLRCKAVIPHDLLVCRLAEPVGRACEVPEWLGPAITSVDCSIIRVNPDRVDRRYLLHWMSTLRWLAAADRVAGGTTRKRISRSNLGQLEVPLPSIEEQVRVAKVIDACQCDLHVLGLEETKLELVRSGLANDLLSGRRTVAA